MEKIAVLLTMGEASDLLRIPVGTLRHWRHLGKGPRSALLGARVMYREQDLEQWVSKQFEGTSTRT